jgi:uncharacterized protein
MSTTLNLQLIESAYDGDEIATGSLLNLGACVDCFDPNGYSAVHWSAFRGVVGNQIEVMTLLIRYGADLNAFTKHNEPQSVLSFAIFSGNSALVRLLLENDVSCDMTSNGVTPLMHAAQANNVEAVELLLSYGADTKLISKGYTAKDYAIYFNTEEISVLLQAAAEGDVARLS